MGLSQATLAQRVQKLLGHSSIQSTARYTKVTERHIERIKSPLDLIGTKEGALIR